MILLDFECSEHGRFESLEPRPGPDEVPCPGCGAASPWRVSAVAGRVREGEVTRGKSDEVPPGAMSTRALADGMPLHEFKAQRRKERLSAMHDKVRYELFK